MVELLEVGCRTNAEFKVNARIPVIRNHKLSACQHRECIVLLGSEGTSMFSAHAPRFTAIKEINPLGALV